MWVMKGSGGGGQVCNGCACEQETESENSFGVADLGFRCVLGRGVGGGHKVCDSL